MRLHLEHTTTYTYQHPVTFRRHRLVLRPREGHDLRIEQMKLDLTPAHHVQWIRDVFGNSIALVDWLEPADSLRIVSDVILERTLPFPARTLHQPWRVSFPPEYDPLEKAIAAVYGDPSYKEDVPALQSWMRDGLVTDAGDGEGSMLALCKLVGTTVSYTRRPEKGVQSPAETLTRKFGSCRDMATLMMDAARISGVAARFVSGYLHGRASMAGHASTHAWVEVYLPTLGWRGFDPTLGDVISGGHIVTGVSTHPRGVMPVSGTFVGSSTDCLSLEVSVRTELL